MDNDISTKMAQLSIASSFVELALRYGVSPLDGSFDFHSGYAIRAEQFRRQQGLSTDLSDGEVRSLYSRSLSMRHAAALNLSTDGWDNMSSNMLVSIVDQEQQRVDHQAWLKEMGLPEDATREQMAIATNRKYGLPDNADANEGFRTGMRRTLTEELAKLGLPVDASTDDILEAVREKLRVGLIERFKKPAEGTPEAEADKAQGIYELDEDVGSYYATDESSLEELDVIACNHPRSVYAQYDRQKTFAAKRPLAGEILAYKRILWGKTHSDSNDC